MNKPFFIIDTEMMSPRGYDCATSIEKGIFDNPEAYLHVLGGVAMTAEMAADPSLDAPAPIPRPTEASEAPELLEAQLLVDEYLDNNYGRYVDYDEETEAEIDEDPGFQKLLQELKSQKTLTIKRNDFSERRPNVAAEETRRKLSKYTLGLFVQHVVAWQRTAETEQHFEEAS
jgi:hypothetical protein